MAFERTAARQAMMRTSYKLDVVLCQAGDIRKQVTGMRDQLRRMEIMLQKIVYSQRNTTEPTLGRSTPEGNFKYPSTGFSVVATGWENPDEVCVKNDARFEDGTVVSKSEGVEFTIKEDLDCAVLEDFGIPSWLFELSLPTPDPIQEPTLVKQWPQSPKEYFSQPHSKYQPRQWNPNFSNERVHNFYKSLEPLEWNQQNETNLAVVNNPDEAKFDLAQLYVVGRADKRLRCTGLFWKLPPGPDFCTMNYDRIAQHSDYKVLVNSHSVKQYNHIHSVLDYTDKFKELVKIWPFVNEAASDTLEDTIKRAIDYSITWPVRKVIPIISGDYNELELKSVGTLVVNLMQARELTNKEADIQSVTVKIYDNDGIQEYELLVSGGTQQVVRVWDPGRSKNMRWHSSPLGVGGGLTIDVVLAAGRAQTLPKIHHCYFIRLTLEYCKFSSLDSYEFHALSRSKKYFNDESVPALEMKIKKLMPMKDESRRLTDWMEKGVYDALQKKYIKTLLFCICEKGEGLMIEEYSFSFSYPNTNGEEVAINFSRTGSKRSGATFKSNAAEVTSDQMRSSACKMNRMLVSLMWTLDQIPEERTILMLAAKLLYAEDSLISNAVSGKAAEASEDLGLVGTPRIDGTTALSNTRIQAGGFSMGQVMQEAEPLFSGAYEGLCLYSSRLMYPIWELLVIVVRGLIVSGDRGDGVETQNLVAQTATEQLIGVKMTKWFDTNYHLIVPELGPSTKFSYSSHKAVNDYKEVIAELKAAGVSWIQFDEPTLVLDFGSYQLAAFSAAYTELELAFSGLNVFDKTYFADIPAEPYKTLTYLNSVNAYGLDLFRGTKTLDLDKSVAFPSGKYFLAGQKDDAYFAANAAVQASGRSSPRVTNEEEESAFEMTNRGIHSNTVFSNTIMGNLFKDGRLMEARNIFDLRVCVGVMPDVVSYNIMIYGYGFVGKMDEVVKLLDGMVLTGWKPNAFIYSTLRDDYCKEGRTEDATTLLKEMLGKGINPGAITYIMMLDGLFKTWRTAVAKELLKSLKVVYKLQLPEGVGIYLAIHVSKLKIHCGPKAITSPDFSLVSKDDKLKVEPISVWEIRVLLRDWVIIQWEVCHLLILLGRYQLHQWYFSRIITHKPLNLGFLIAILEDKYVVEGEVMSDPAIAEELKRRPNSEDNASLAADYLQPTARMLPYLLAEDGRSRLLSTVVNQVI